MDYDVQGEKMKNSMEGGDKKTATFTKGFFQVEDIVDYDLEENSESKAPQCKKQERKQDELNLDEMKMNRRRKNPRKIKLEPLKKEEPRLIVDIAVEDKNPEDKSNTFKQTTTLNVLDFDEENEFIDESPKKKQQNNGGERKPSQNQEQPLEQGGQMLQNQLVAPFNKIYPYINQGLRQSYIIRRDKQWLNKLRPQFNVHYLANNEYLMSGKLASSMGASTFIASIDKENFVQQSSSYLGKVKTNFIGNLINIFGPGFNPKDALEKKIVSRELLATVEYETNFFGTTKPRDFNIYLLKEGAHYHRLRGIKVGEDEVPLNELYGFPENREKIWKFTNKKPQYNQNTKTYMLNFEGRAKMASVKNFLVEKENEDEVMMFGRISENEFRLDIHHPLSPYIAFGITLSCFGSKIGCE